MTSDSGFGWESSPICISLSCIMDLSKFYILFALCQKSKLKFNQDSKACWSFCFELKALNESKFSMHWVHCAFGNTLIHKDQSWDQFFRLLLKHFMRQNLFKVLDTCISLENDISTARFLRVKDFTLTFYLEISEIPRLFWDQNFLRLIPRLFLRPDLSRPILRLFWDQNFRDWYGDFF